MNPKRMDELKEDYRNALKRLNDALTEDLSKSIVVDGVIQRFEFTFELGWKTLRAALEFQGVQAATPRAVIKEAFQAKIITDGDGWIDMLEDRNKTSHLYNEEQAQTIYRKIKAKHAALLSALEARLRVLAPPAA